jgi:hypothetical protein
LLLASPAHGHEWGLTCEFTQVEVIGYAFDFEYRYDNRDDGLVPIALDHEHARMRFVDAPLFVTLRRLVLQVRRECSPFGQELHDLVHRYSSVDSLTVLFGRVGRDSYPAG